MNTIRGNLLTMFDEGDFDTIIHGCNTQANMGGGIAAQIAKKWPVVEQIDQMVTEAGLATLGHYSIVPRIQRACATPGTIVNAYTQPLPGRNARLHAIVKSFRRMKERGIFENSKNVGIPQIGAGIGGLQWSDVELALDRLNIPNLYVVEYAS